MIKGLVKLTGSAVTNRFTLGAAAGVAGLTVYLGTRRPDGQVQLDARLTTAAELVLTHAVPEVRAGDKVENLVVLPLAGDNTFAVTDRLRELVREDGRFNLSEGGTVGRMARKAGWDFATAKSVEEAAAEGKRLGANLVLWGTIDHWRIAKDETGGELALALSLVEVPTKKETWSKAYDSASLARNESERGTFERVAVAAGKVLIWFLATVALPIMGWPAVRKILDQDSNGWNFFLLMLLTAASTAVAFALMRFDVSSHSRIVTLVLAGLAGAWIHYRNCSMLEDQRLRDMLLRVERLRSGIH